MYIKLKNKLYINNAIMKLDYKIIMKNIQSLQNNIYVWCSRWLFSYTNSHWFFNMNTFIIFIRDVDEMFNKTDIFYKILEGLGFNPAINLGFIATLLVDILNGLTFWYVLFFLVCLGISIIYMLPAFGQDKHMNKVAFIVLLLCFTLIFLKYILFLYFIKVSTHITVITPVIHKFNFVQGGCVQLSFMAKLVAFLTLFLSFFYIFTFVLFLIVFYFWGHKIEKDTHYYFLMGFFFSFGLILFICFFIFVLYTPIK